jgi:predicted nucleic acid-binding protein
VPAPGPRHHEILERLILDRFQQHRHVPDAHLAALAIEQGSILAIRDRGFGRFEGLRWELPLVA